MLDNIDAALESAISSHESGDLLIAGEKYLEILKANPNHPDANHNFGLLTVKLGEPLIAMQFLKTAIEANPIFVDVHTKWFKPAYTRFGGNQQLIRGDYLVAPDNLTISNGQTTGINGIQKGAKLNFYYAVTPITTNIP